ncbi:VOC family protein [Robertmurraya korlensis]|uniref:VOC family protein n=1 Tax=Robertmurraya korlensis TaxID=519977 RepID=UPI000824691D|nr:glyoxalase/bleomycin resistance/dioxygenase family protein [Robertmurraya korlensis]
MDEHNISKFGVSIQVRLVSDLKKAQIYYRNQLGCGIDDWGHATRDQMTILLQQASSPTDVRPNALAKKRPDYPSEWQGPDHAWDTFVHVEWDDVERIVEDVRNRGGIIAVEPFFGSHGGWDFKNAHLSDLDGYNIVLGAMRKSKND